MSMISRYCSQCGHNIEVRKIEGREREVCSDCGMIFYRNPLPVAAVIVLNRNREVLLVKRKNEPRKGMWCLPMGFAELNESIAQACLRELDEETGIHGEISRLIAVRSTVIEPYGDLLVATFEAVKTGGAEKAGDDAEELGYFSLDALPPLAFEPNDYAIRYCISIHKEDWAIQDSFKHMQKGSSGQSMLSDALVAFIRDHAEEITGLWLKDVRSNPTTSTYGKMEQAELHERAFTAISQFYGWLSGVPDDKAIKDFYTQLGKERREHGFGLYEVISSLSLLRKHVVTFAIDKGVWERAIDAYTVLELDRRIILFFDKAIYYTAKGFACDN
ncbi:MAG: NUDIX domain-containing protein [Spirochaetota bacterium]